MAIFQGLPSSFRTIDPRSMACAYSRSALAEQARIEVLRGVEGCLTHLRSPGLRQRPEAREGSDKIITILSGEEISVLPVVDNFARPGGIDGHHGCTGGHGLGQHHALRLGLRGESKYVHRFVRTDQERSSQYARRMKTPREPFAPKELFDILQRRPGTHNKKVRPGIGLHIRADAASQESQILLGRQPADMAYHITIGGKTEHRAHSGSAALFEALDFDAGRDDVDRGRDPALANDLDETLAGCEDLVAQVRVPSGDFGDKGF